MKKEQKSFEKKKASRQVSPHFHKLLLLPDPDGKHSKHVCTDMNVGFLEGIGRPQEKLLELDHQRVIVHCDLLVGTIETVTRCVR